MNMIRTMAGLAAKMKPDEEIQVQKVRIGKIPVLILRPVEKTEDGDKMVAAPALLWIHGGGYFLGMKEMVYLSRAADLVKKFGITVVSPGYRLAFVFWRGTGGRSGFPISFRSIRCSAI